MFYRVSSLSLSPDEREESLWKKAAMELSVSSQSIESLRIYRKSLDARGGKVRYRFTVDVFLREGVAAKPSENCKCVERESSYFVPTFAPRSLRPVVVGFGPAGMFAALLLARAGLCPIVLERGKRVEERVRDVEGFFGGKGLLPDSNIQFGEGGAGTFSDGKLNTLLKDKNFRGRFVLEEMVRFGAPEEILYLNKPHIGTDRLRRVVSSLREEIIRLGGSVWFETTFLAPVFQSERVVGLRYRDSEGEKELDCDAIFLAIGHSARDTFRTLFSCGVPMEKKIFSVGVRIEHLQEKINRAQYKGASDLYRLPAADYKLAVPVSDEKRVYTFCMCPGGSVVPATSEDGCVVVNGMSDFARDGENANSALLYNVLPEELGDDPLCGFDFQKELEKKAFLAGGGDFSAPCQLVGDFMKKQKSRVLGSVCPSYARGATLTDLDLVLPETISAALREALPQMGRLLEGFDASDAVLTGVESRATCPVRIVRDETMQSSFRGLFPLGEGAGYAGGIMSSAMDGMKGAEAYFKMLESEL